LKYFDAIKLNDEQDRKSAISRNSWSCFERASDFFERAKKEAIKLINKSTEETSRWFKLMKWQLKRAEQVKITIKKFVTESKIREEITQQETKNEITEVTDAAVKFMIN
jgi:hypothetical protein